MNASLASVRLPAVEHALPSSSARSLRPRATRSGTLARLPHGDELRLLREATRTLDTSAAQLERARAHAQLGAALRRAGKPTEAREPLRLAVDLAHRCGADALEDHALAELRATGARPRRRLTTGAGALTPSERRVASLAAAGELNREIAETLVVTIYTVEFHLRNAYRKLGIASRTQLGTALRVSGVGATVVGATRR